MSFSRKVEAGEEYTWRDRLRGQATRYWLQELYAGGRDTWYGPRG